MHSRRAARWRLADITMRIPHVRRHVVCVTGGLALAEADLKNGCTPAGHRAHPKQSVTVARARAPMILRNHADTCVAVLMLRVRSLIRGVHQNFEVRRIPFPFQLSVRGLVVPSNAGPGYRFLLVDVVTVGAHMCSRLKSGACA